MSSSAGPRPGTAKVETERVRHAGLRLLRRGYQALFEGGSGSGDWHEVRSTALAALCLWFRQPGDSPWVVAARDWLIKEQIREGPCEGSWGEEIWDTALATLALDKIAGGYGPAFEAVARASRWIRSQYAASGRPNWHDEQWETTWALLALLNGEASLPQDELSKTLVWLADRVRDSQGGVIDGHYPAYFILVSQSVVHVALPTEVAVRVEETRRACVQHLMNQLRASPPEGQPDHLWTGEAWSNGQILWALAPEPEFTVEDPSLSDRIVQWFTDSRHGDGWSDVEDTASAMLGLNAFLRRLSHDDRALGSQHRPAASADHEIETWLHNEVVLPRLKLRKRIWDHDSETGYYALNFHPTVVKFAVVFVGAFLAWVADVVPMLLSLFRMIAASFQ